MSVEPDNLRDGHKGNPPWKKLWDRCYQLYLRLYVFTNKEPVLTIRRALWIFTTGWALAIGYLLAAVGMVTSLVFIPFAPAAARFALFALDTVTQENYIHIPAEGEQLKWYQNPVHPFCIAANILWLIFFGWPLFLGHVASALVQIPTIIGIPTAVTQLQMAKFALWPFGQGVRRRFLPKSMEELNEHDEARQPLASREYASSDEAEAV
jgi:uncharacterized membrane protein YccF (DUF307 family)